MIEIRFISVFIIFFFFPNSILLSQSDSTNQEKILLVFPPIDKKIGSALYISVPKKPEVSDKHVSSKYFTPGVYKQVLNPSKTIISAGEEITIKQFFSGYGIIDVWENKIFFSSSAQILDTSYLISGISKNKQGKIQWGNEKELIGNDATFVKQLNSYTSTINIDFDSIRLYSLRDSLRLDNIDYIDVAIILDSLEILDAKELIMPKVITESYFDPVKKNTNYSINFKKNKAYRNIEGTNLVDSISMVINSEKSFDNENTSAPLLWKLKTKKDTPPGNYLLNFIWTYHNGNNWVVEEKSVEIKVMNWFERNDKYIVYLAIMASIISLSPVLKFFSSLKVKKFIKQLKLFISKVFRFKK